MQPGVRLFAWIFTTIILYNQGGYFLFYLHLREEARKNMQWEIQQHLFQDKDLLGFSVKETETFNWENRHEFEMDGHMYDVVYQNSDSIFVMMDKKEEHVISFFISDKKNSDPGSGSFFQWLKKYKEQISEEVFQVHYAMQPILHKPAPHCYNYCVVYGTTDDPPPRG